MSRQRQAVNRLELNRLEHRSLPACPDRVPGLLSLPRPAALPGLPLVRVPTYVSLRPRRPAPLPLLPQPPLAGGSRLRAIRRALRALRAFRCATALPLKRSQELTTRLPESVVAFS